MCLNGTVSRACWMSTLSCVPYPVRVRARGKLNTPCLGVAVLCFGVTISRQVERRPSETQVSLEVSTRVEQKFGPFLQSNRHWACPQNHTLCSDSSTKSAPAEAKRKGFQEAALTPS